MTAAAASAVRNLTRLRTPHTIAALGRNYAAHIAELNNPTPSEPFYFLKPAGSVLHPNSGPVLSPPNCNLHYEVELAAVIGKDADVVKKESALDYVKGWAVVVDMTARGYQDKAKKKGLPWTLGKGFSTFLPVSHFIPKEKIPNPGKVELWLKVNGEDKQRDSTELMLNSTEECIQFVTGVCGLVEDDLVLTGTPKGVGSVVDGDVITAGVKVDGVELEEGRIEVEVKDRTDGYGIDWKANL